MTTLSARPWFPPVLVGTGAATLIASLAGYAAVLGWLPVDWAVGPTPGRAPAHRERVEFVIPEAFRPLSSCASCGTVEAVRLVQVRSPANEPAQRAHASYRITVRMDDGSYRTLAQSTQPSLGVGDGVQIMHGAIVARR